MNGFRRILASTWCWAVLVFNTVFWFALGLILTPFRGRRHAYAFVLQMWGRCNMFLGGFRCRSVNLEHLNRPAVLACNHRSIFDICLLSALVPRPFYFVARTGVLKAPIIGWVLRLGGHILVQRGSAASNEKSVEMAVERARAGGRVIFFPEGTRSDDGSTRPFRGGAFRVAEAAGRPLIPVALIGTEHSVGKGSGFIIPSRMLLQVFQPRDLQPGEGASRQVREDVRQMIAAAVVRHSPETGPRV